MQDIFISYARVDIERVEPLVELFEANGLTVWWDSAISPGSTFENVIDDAIMNSRLVVVVWTENSIHSEWVQAEASDAMERGILIPVMLDQVRVPVAFRRAQSINLFDWPRYQDDRELERLLASLLERLEKGSHPPSLPTHDGRRRKGAGRLAPGLIALVFLICLAGYLLLPLEKTSEEGPVDGPEPLASIAVLPFTSAENVALPEAYDGLAFEVAGLLRRAGALQIASEAQVEDFLAQSRGRRKARLDTDYQLTGMVERAANAATAGTDRVVISLMDVGSGRGVWSQHYPLAERDMAATVRSIADHVAARFHVSLPVLEQDIAPAAYLVYLKAQAELRKPVNLDMLQLTRALFEEVAELEPRFASGFAGLCRTELLLYQETQMLEDFESAEKHCNRANILSSDESSVYVALGALYRDSGKPMDSLDNLNRAIRLTPFSTEVMRELARTYIALRNAEEAEQQILAALKIEPSFWLNYREMGRIQFVKGDYPRAAEYYKLEAELAPDNSRALNNLGAAYFMSEQFDQAIAVWEGAPDLEKNDRTLANLGSAYVIRREFQRAADMYAKALAIVPEDHEYWGALGEAQFFAGVADYRQKYHKALELAKPRLAINPNDVMLLSAVATYYAALGMEQEADSIISRLLAVDVIDVYTVYDIARTYARLGREVRARQYMNQLIEMGYSRNLLSLDANFDGVRPAQENQ
ncbi:MAG: TIR domain-containing protein [Halieaceae bacterium]